MYKTLGPRAIEDAGSLARSLARANGAMIGCYVAAIASTEPPEIVPEPQLEATPSPAAREAERLDEPSEPSDPGVHLIRFKPRRSDWPGGL